MDYKLLKNVLSPIIQGNLNQVEQTRNQLAGIQAENTIDKNVLAILKNVQRNLEVSESLKKLAKTILDQSEFFSDDSVHQSTKGQALKKILATNNFVENNKLFNLSTLQAYLDNIIQKQLYEINIKIEENQRSLNNLSFSQPQKQAEPETAEMVKQKYLLVESEQEKSAVQFDSIIEILKFPAPFPKKTLVEFTMIYNKICGPAKSHVLKKFQDITIPSRQVLGNANMTMKNSEEKNFALISKKDDEFTIFFVDYVLYTNPVEGQDAGGIIKTSEDTYRIIEV